MEELKPCPFCGGEAQIDPEGDCYEITCIDCGVFRQGHTYEEAIEAWNRREGNGPTEFPQTNADRINAMSIEEKAKFLADFLKNPHEILYSSNREYLVKVTDVLMDWLKQEVE